MTDITAVGERTRVRRSAHLARYDAATLHAIVDAAYICQVAFYDGASTHCIPTACWRSGEYLYIHGSNGSRMVKLLAQGTQACVTITHVDGLVLARSAFAHTMNYRSAAVYGSFETVDGEAAKHAALHAFMDKLAPGRQAEVRTGSPKEYAATTVLRIALGEAACKVREGGPNDEEEDMARPAWAGVLPLEVRHGAPVRHTLCDVEAPRYVAAWKLNEENHQ